MTYWQWAIADIIVLGVLGSIIGHIVHRRLDQVKARRDGHGHR